MGGALGGDPFNPAGPWEFCLLPQSPPLGALEDGGYTGCGSPSVPHQSHRSRLHPLPDVQECEARGCSWWGEGRDAYRGAGLGASFRCYSQSYPTLPLGAVWGGGRAVGGDPAPPPDPSPGAVRGAEEERAPAGLGGEPLARGPADFLLISSRKLASCVRPQTALGHGESGAPVPPAP